MIILEAIGKAVVGLIILVIVGTLAFTAYALPPFLVGSVIVPYLESTSLDGQVVFILSVLSVPLMYGFMILLIGFIIAGLLKDRTED